MKTFLNTATSSWRTTTAGVLLFVSALCGAGMALLDNDPATAADWNAVGNAGLAMVALILARDNVVSSEQVRGARLKS